MTVRTKLERNKMSRGYTLLWSDDAFPLNGTSEWNGIVGETRESLTWAQHLLRCWSKRKTGLNAALNGLAVIPPPNFIGSMTIQVFGVHGAPLLLLAVRK